jgi:hypothetical protein
MVRLGELALEYQLTLHHRGSRPEGEALMSGGDCIPLWAVLGWFVMSSVTMYLAASVLLRAVEWVRESRRGHAVIRRGDGTRARATREESRVRPSGRGAVREDR